MSGRKPTAHDMKEILGTNLVNLIAWQQSYRFTALFELYDSAPWFDKFQHLYFLHRALNRARYLSIGPGADVIARFEQYTHRKWTEFVETEVRSNNPEVADAFRECTKDYDAILVPDTSSDFRELA
ncbi:hypothetical protein JCM3765_001252 [Sporobolomyces pararoseus]